PFKTLCFFNYALMIRQDYDITSSLRRGALQLIYATTTESVEVLCCCILYDIACDYDDCVVELVSLVGPHEPA
nr:hypothetical protein [Tanacetum cinerariifolium]